MPGNDEDAPTADNDRELGLQISSNARDSSVFERQVMCTSADYDIYAASCGMRMFRYSGRSPWMNVTFGTGWAQTRFA